MADFAPISIKAVDQTGREIFNVSVPFTFEIDVKRLIESAFVLAQQPPPANPDPFHYTVGYYGFSEDPRFPGYLGYEIETINGLPTNGQFYWQLSVNGVVSTTGADTTLPNPGATVAWNYTPIPQNPADLTSRTQVVHARRSSRAAAKS
ncbi:MAG: DUF4430 domain-containing protein [Chthoniobacteraceae bacterium]